MPTETAATGPGTDSPHGRHGRHGLHDAPVPPSAMAVLEAKWYGALVAGLGLDPARLQLAASTAALGDTSELLWSCLDALPPASPAAPVPAGGAGFHDRYQAVLAQLALQGDAMFREELGDEYEVWTAFLARVDPPPRPDDLPDLFRRWASAECPDPRLAQRGAIDLEEALRDPVFRAQLAIRDTSGFAHGVPDRARTIADLRAALAGAPSGRVAFDSSTASPDTAHAWASVEASGLPGFFGADPRGPGDGDGAGADPGGPGDGLGEKAAASVVTVDARIDHVLTFAADPGGWFVPAALAAAVASQGAPWVPGGPGWAGAFGPGGTLVRVTAGLVVVDGLEATVTSDAAYTADEQRAIEARVAGGVWPFLASTAPGASGGLTGVAAFDGAGRMTVRVVAPPGEPCVLGVDVAPVAGVAGAGRGPG